VKAKYGDKLLVLRLSQKGYSDLLEGALSTGSTVLIENIGESVDAVLEPLLGRNLIKKGRCVRKLIVHQLFLANI
jgi:dynein heavy chain, axonemal